MLNDKTLQTAFLISFTGHCLLLAPFGFNLNLHQKGKKTEEVVVKIAVERRALLPKIDIMGKEKKIKAAEQKQKPEPRPLLFSEQTAEQRIPQEHIKEKVDVVNTKKEAMFRYQDMVKQKIEESRRYPLWAKKQGIEGTAYLYFTVLPNGLGHNVQLVQSSGSNILDAEAISTVKRASPFPPIPKEISNSSVGMEVAIVFSLANN